MFTEEFGRHRGVVFITSLQRSIYSKMIMGGQESFLQPFLPTHLKDFKIKFKAAIFQNLTSPDPLT